MKDMFIFVGWLGVGVDSKIVSEEEEEESKKTLLVTRLKEYRTSTTKTFKMIYF